MKFLPSQILQSNVQWWSHVENLKKHHIQGAWKIKSKFRPLISLKSRLLLLLQGAGGGGIRCRNKMVTDLELESPGRSKATQELRAEVSTTTLTWDVFMARMWSHISNVHVSTVPTNLGLHMCCSSNPMPTSDRIPSSTLTPVHVAPFFRFSLESFALM